MLKKIVLVVQFFVCVMFLKAQHYTGNNYVAIRPTDTYKNIIRKAASVTPSARQLRWQQLELTAFFHFGVNTFTGNEWGDGTENPAIFNPIKLDAGQWVKTMKDAGFKQVIITAKHHDGFCLWPSQYTEHSVKNSPYKNGKGDVVKEVADACKKQGIGFGVYLSPWDRNYPDYGVSEKYNAYFMNQLTELLTNYGQVDEVWFDGANGTGPNGKIPVYDFNSWYALIRKLQPAATIAIMGPDVRWVGTESGYGRETEWSVITAGESAQRKTADDSQKEVTDAPVDDVTNEDLGGRNKLKAAKALKWYPAETDVSIRDGWFYRNTEDSLVKSPQKLLDIYFSSVGRNSVLLLNVPPNKDGLISDSDIAALQKWTALREGIFANNLAKKAVLTSNGNKIKSITDDVYATHYISPEKDLQTTINLSFNEPVRFDVLLLQEDIAIGQRIEKFVLEYKEGGSWKEAAAGTTVGYKRLLRFKPVEAKEVRLRVASSRLNFTISELGLYKQ